VAVAMHSEILLLHLHMGVGVEVGIVSLVLMQLYSCLSWRSGEGLHGWGYSLAFLFNFIFLRNFVIEIH
jgi:hypothetical protein